MKELSYISSFIKPSLTRKLFNMAKEYTDVIDFTLGDPDVPTPEAIKSAGCDAIKNNKMRYSQNAGLIDLRKTISDFIRKREDLSYNPYNEILVSVGAMEGLYLALLALLNPGDEVIIPAPYYVNYVQMVLMCGGKPVIVEDYDNQDLLSCSSSAIINAVTPKTKAIIINNPSNPSGHIFDDRFLSEIAELSIKHDLYVITDEVYKCLIYDKKQWIHSIASFPKMKERTIYVNSLSKEFCMTGWRIGYVVANSDIISVMTKFQENVVACAPLSSQYAAIEALRTDIDYSQQMKEIFQKRRDVLYDEFQKIDGVTCRKPMATFYAMIDISKTNMGSEEFAYKLLENQHVAVVPGVAYGKIADCFIRIAYTVDEKKITEGISRIGKFVKYLA